MKKLAIAALTMLAAVTSTAAQAAWNHAEVILAGASNDGKVYLRLKAINDTNNAFGGQERIFILSENLKDIGLAIGLAATSSNRQVLIESNVDTVDPSKSPTIRLIYMTNKIVE